MDTDIYMMFEQSDLLTQQVWCIYKRGSCYGNNEGVYGGNVRNGLDNFESEMIH